MALSTLAHHIVSAISERRTGARARTLFAQVTVDWYGVRCELSFEHQEAVLFDQVPAGGFRRTYELVRGHRLLRREPLPKRAGDFVVLRRSQPFGAGRELLQDVRFEGYRARSDGSHGQRMPDIGAHDQCPEHADVTFAFGAANDA